MVTSFAKVLAASVVAAGLGAGAATVAADPDTPAPTGDCAQPYDRAKYFGSVPTPSARKAAIDAATVDGVVIDYYVGGPVVGTPDVDHVYSVKDSWPVMCGKTRVERRSYANDPINLVPTSASVNRGKGELSPKEWQPVDRARACAYGVLFLRVAAKYDLPVDEADATAVQSACADAIG